MRSTLLLCSALLVPFSLRGQTDDHASDRAHAVLSKLADEGFQGSALVSRGDSILFHQSFGVPDRASTVRYWVASVTKGLTAIAVLRLAEDGILDIDDPVSRHFPNVPADKSEITIFDLLTHQSGLPQNYIAEGISDRSAAAAAILAQPLEHKPGVRFTYSNDNYSLLAIVIELATGISYAEVVTGSITDPLDLQEIAFWPQPARAGETIPPLLSSPPEPEGDVDWGFLGGHGARLSVGELHAIGVALERGALLSGESLALLYGPHRSLSSGVGVGMGWFSETDVEGRRLLWTRGYDTSGANAVLYFVENDLVVVVATNAGPAEDAGPGWSRVVRDALFEIYAPPARQAHRGSSRDAIRQYSSCRRSTTQLGSLATSTSRQDALVVTGIHVVPMQTEQVLSDHALRIEGGEIVWIGPETDPPTEGARVVDGEGAFAVPGLIDMHVHLRSDDELDLYLLNGVTTIVNLSGSPRHLETRRRIAAGKLRGPTLYTSGPIIDGDPPRSSESPAAGTAARGAEIVNEQVDAGYDLIKIYDLIEKDAYDGVTRAARERGAPVVGHLSKKFDFEGHLGGHDLVAHAEEYFYTWFEWKPDAERIAEVARMTAKAGIAVTPNTAMFRSIIEQAESLDTVLARPGVQYLPPSTRMRWLPEGNRYVGQPEEWLANLKVMYPFLVQLTRGLHDAGVVLVTGSDASGPGAEPGFSLHREIRELERIGLTPYEALRAATANPGGWLEQHLSPARPMGVIDTGYAADLVLFGANPLENLDALSDVRAIVVRGEWIDRDAILSDVETRAAVYDRELALYESFKDHLAAGRFVDAEAIVGTTDLIDESLINELGYHYLERDELDTAIAVFSMNVRTYPESANTYDSLGEAYLNAGQTQLAIENYRKSLELDPGNTNAVEMLEKLGVGPNAR